MHQALTFPDNELLMMGGGGGSEDEDQQTGIIGPPSVNRSLTYPQMMGGDGQSNLSVTGTILGTQSSDVESNDGYVCSFVVCVFIALHCVVLV